MNLPTLYKNNHAGKLQEWTIYTKSNTFWSEEGVVDGVITKSTPTVCEGKNLGRANETTPEQQALCEAKAKWQRKLDKGYVQDKSKVNDAMAYFEPMLCKKYEDYKSQIDFSTPVFVQPKLDGMRNICKQNGMFTRNGKPVVSAPHIFAALKSILDLYPDTIFDGELYCNKFKNDFNSIISLVKKTKPTPQDLKDSAASIQYWIYDLPSCDEVFSERTKQLKALLKTINDPCIVYVETHEVKSFDETDNLYGKWLEEGYEGQIIRLDSKYECKRSSKILKRKEFQDAEYLVTGVGAGVGNRTGTLGYVTCQTADGKSFKSNIKGTFEYVTQLWNDRDNLIGKWVTIKFFALTPDGIPRFPYVIGIRDYE